MASAQESLLELRVTRGPPKLRRCPENFIVAMILPVSASSDARRVNERHVRVSDGPGEGAFGCCQAERGEGCIVCAVAARRNRHDRRKAGGGAGALVRDRTGADDVAGERVLLGHHEAAELFARLLVPDSAVLVLQGEHPFKVPANFRQIIGELSSRFRDTQGEGTQDTRVKLPRPQEGSRGDGAIDDVTAIVACVVPSAEVLERTRASGAGMVSARWMAFCMAVATAKVDFTTTPLAVEGACGQHQWMQINILTEKERLRANAACHQPVRAGNGQSREVGEGHSVSRSGVYGRSRQLSLKDGTPGLLGVDLERSIRGVFPR